MKHDLLHIQGKPYVLVPLHEYRKMLDAGVEADDGVLPQEILDSLYAGQEQPLKILRKHRGLTQAELAEAAGLSRPYLTEIERGKKIGSVRSLTYIANALNIPVSYLVLRAV